MKIKLSAALLLAGALVGCQSNDDLDSARSIHEAPAPSLPAASHLALSELTGSVPATPAGRGLTWTLERLNLAPEAATEEAVLSAFDPTVLEQASAGAIAEQLQVVGRERPFAFVGLVEAPTDNRIVAALMSRNGYQQATVEVGPEGRMTVLMFEPLTPGSEPATPLPSGEMPTAPAAAADAAPAAPAAPAEAAPAADGSAAAAPAEAEAAPAEGDAAPAEAEAAPAGE